MNILIWGCGIAKWKKAEIAAQKGRLSIPSSQLEIQIPVWFEFRETPRPLLPNAWVRCSQIFMPHCSTDDGGYFVLKTRALHEACHCLVFMNPVCRHIIVYYIPLLLFIHVSFRARNVWMLELCGGEFLLTHSCAGIFTDDVVRAS